MHDGRRIIGLLERGLSLILLLVGQHDAIGFRIAAKSILRFGTVAVDRAISEYVNSGTLAWSGCAIAAMLTLQDHLPPLVLPPPAP